MNPRSVFHMMVLLLCGVLPGCTGDDKQLDLSAVTKALQQDASDRSEVRVDPSRCPGGGDGYVYFALGPKVVRVNHVDTVDIVRVTREFDHTALMWLPPDPAAPEGCFGHPIKVQTLPLTQYQDVLLGKNKALGSSPLMRFHLFRQTSQALMRTDGEVLLGSMMQQFPCRPVADDLVECGSPDTSANRTSLLTIVPDIYSTPMGHPFVVMCGFGPGIYNDDCSVKYQLDQVTAVRYGIRRSSTPDRAIIPIDRALRKGLSEIVVPAYLWRNANQ